ncbi:hypothetical protein OHA21_40340 [Actinoplanes sp. NBC_00393]|uniref:hypothetical protein n=1 Tax=Actinoplanes sp. NBC_00393 TaxID=2975953 RepID=UPI002E23A776
MSMLASLVDRGGRPAAISPTVALRGGEKQYGWFPVDVAGVGRRLAVITDRRLILGNEEYQLRSIAALRPRPEEWRLVLDVRGLSEPVTVSGPWVPWLGVVICAELYSAAWPPGFAPMSMIPAPRRQEDRVLVRMRAL